MSIKPNQPINPLHTRCIELCEQVQVKAGTLRDYATTPSNAWLAKGELQSISGLIAELDSLLEQIKLSEA